MPWVRKQPVRVVAPSAPPPVPVAPVVAQPDPLTAGFPAEVAPIVTTLAELKEVGSGVLATAITAPKEGDIPVTPGTPVVVLAKSLRDSPTFKKAWLAVSLAWGAFWTYVVIAVFAAGGLWNVNWKEVSRNATLPALATAAGVYGIKLKLGDNDPIVNSSLKKDPPKEEP